MASLLGTNHNKKIIVFSHKEIFYFHDTYVRKRWLLLLPVYLLMTITKKIRSKYFVKKLDELSQKHLIGVHWGWKFENFKTPQYIDYHLSGKNTLNLRADDNTPILNYSSSTFLPSFFCQSVPYEHRIYDIILVNRLATFKNTDLFIASVSEVLKRNAAIKILLVLPTEPNESERTHHDINALLEKFIPIEHRNAIIVLRSDPNYVYLGFPRAFVADLIARSRVLCLFSEGEGVAKVIKEAQSLGTKVVAFDKLSGGGLDFDNDLIFKFDDYATAHETIIDAIETRIDKQDNYKEIIDSTQKMTNEIHNCDLFKHDLQRLFHEKFNEAFAGQFDLEDLSRRLPNHSYDLHRMPWISSATGQTNATDILTISSFRKFLSYV
jgi:glycosyltransferase involved in cell wall biosynthesis